MVCARVAMHSVRPVLTWGYGVDPSALTRSVWGPDAGVVRAVRTS